MRAMAAVIVGAAMMTACAGPAETANAPPEAAETEAQAVPSGALGAPVEEGVTLVIAADQSVQTITVPVGQRFAVALVGVPTAGYVWAPSMVPAFLTRAGEGGGPTVAAQNEPGYTGGNHWEVHYFSATEAGEGQLSLAQRRPWETNEAPADSFAVTIRAQ
jgi:inhibitor of cysteine peptidase